MPPPKLKYKGSAREIQSSCRLEIVPVTYTSQASEPVPKRKTLVERAGEAPRTLPGLPTSRPAKLAISAANLASIKPVSIASSNSSRLPSTTSRNFSNSSASTSSSNTRPSSASSNYGPQSILASSRSVSNGLSQHKRSASSLDDDDDDAQTHTAPTKRKGMPLSTLSAIQLQDRLRPQKQRERTAAPGLSQPFPLRNPSSRSQSPYFSSRAEILSRNISLSTAFEGLTLRQRSDQTQGSVFPCSSPIPHSPSTPSQIPKPLPKTPNTQQAQPCKTPLTKYKIRHASPLKLEYLTRDSNTPAPAWDTKGRLEDMENLYSHLKNQFEGAASEKNGLEESLALYKMRRKCAQTALLCILTKVYSSR